MSAKACRAEPGCPSNLTDSQGVGNSTVTSQRQIQGFTFSSHLADTIETTHLYYSIQRRQLQCQSKAPWARRNFILKAVLDSQDKRKSHQNSHLNFSLPGFQGEISLEKDIEGLWASQKETSLSLLFFFYVPTQILNLSEIKQIMCESYLKLGLQCLGHRNKPINLLM